MVTASEARGQAKLWESKRGSLFKIQLYAKRLRKTFREYVSKRKQQFLEYVSNL